MSDEAAARTGRQSMGATAADWSRPWTEAWAYPAGLMRWITFAIGVGSVGIWSPYVLGSSEVSHPATLASLGTFCLVLLADSFAISQVTRTPDHLAIAENGKSVAHALAIPLLLFQAFLVAHYQSAPVEQVRGAGLQIGIGLAVVSTAAYLICFVLGDLQPTVGKHSEQEAATISDLAREADTVASTSDGEKL